MSATLPTYKDDSKYITKVAVPYGPLAADRSISPTRNAFLRKSKRSPENDN